MQFLTTLFVAMLVGAVAHAQRPTVRVDLVYTTQKLSDPSPITTSDATFIYFEAGATTDFDGAFDATKLPNSTGLNLSSLTVPIPSTIPGIPTNLVEQLSINGLPASLLAVPYTVNLFVGVPAYTSVLDSNPPPNGTPFNSYSLSVSQINFFTSTRVYLLDAVSGASVPLTPGTTYSFDATAANTNAYTTTRFSLLFEPTGTLPVTLTSFTAQEQAPGVALAWHTANERNSAYFAIERSATGQTYTEIGRVAAAGTSAQAHSYAFYDAQLLDGTSYYRLRQVDTDNTFQYSPVRAVGSPSAAAGLTLFPNPARAGMALRGVAPGTPLHLVNTLGQVVATAQADASGLVVLPSTLPSGVYVVRSGQQATRLVIN